MPAGYWNPDTGQTEWNPNTPGYRKALEYYRSQQQGGSPASQAIAQGQKDVAGIGTPLQINQAAVAAADPFASQRPQYQNALQNLMSGQTDITQLPGFQAASQAAQQGLERSMAAKGYLGSGNILAELQKQQQQIGLQEFGNQFDRLLPLTGATSGSPGAAGQITAGLYDWRNNALANIGGGMAMNQPIGGMTTSSSLVMPTQNQWMATQPSLGNINALSPTDPRNQNVLDAYRTQSMNALQQQFGGY